MNQKQFGILKIGVVMVMAGVVGYGVTINNFLLPVIAVAIAMLVLLIARGKVKEVIADERDWEIGGRAALLAMQIFASMAVVAIFILLWQKAANIWFEQIAYVLAYSVSLLMLLYAGIFKYLNRR